MKRLLILALPFALLVAGCAPAPAPTAAPVGTTAKATAKTGTVPAYRNAQGQLFCPVMKAVVASEADAVGYADHEGKRYYFCCAMCPDKFKADPEAYVSQL